MIGHAHNQGFVRLILILVAVFLFISYFNIDIKKTVESPTTQANASYVKSASTTVWHRYLEVPASYLCKNIFINLFWDSFVENMQRIKDGRPTTIEQKAPMVGN
jgi:hypothetical protein